MAGKRIAVLTPDGKFGTIDEEHADALTKAGGRVLTSKQLAERELAEQYAQQSTAKKVAGAVTSSVAGPIASNALAATGAVAVQPEVEALHQGMADPMTLGLDRVAVKAALEATGGKAAAQAYTKHQKQIAEAHPEWHTAGEVAGFAAQALGGSATGAARAVPGLGVSALGAGAENLAARALGGVAARGALGQAVATGGKLAARGAAEGALYGAGHQITEDMLGDQELAADKIFAAAGTGALYGAAGGAALGTAGSLLASGAKAAGGAVKGGLARALARSEASAVKAEEAAVEGAAKAKPLALSDAIGNPNEAARKISNELAVDALNPTKKQLSNALEHVGSKADVGEYVNRIAIKPATEGAGLVGGALRAGASGRADQLLETIKADKYGRIATGLSDAVKGTPARLNVSELVAKGDEIYGGMLKDPTKIAGADSFINRVKLEAKAIQNAGKVAADGTIDAADAFYLRASMEKQAYELSKTSGAAGEAYKTYLREWDRSVVNAIDDAAKAAGPSRVKQDILHWKREWQLSSAAEELAQHGVERLQGNNIIGIRESIGGLAGIATGHPIAGLATIAGGKIVKERGAAAGAFLLSRVADMGGLAKVLRGVDDQIGRASKGLLQAPAKRPPAEPFPATRPQLRAADALKRVGDFQANPEAFVERAARETEAIGVNAPGIAAGLTRRMVQSMAFLSSKVPVQADRDPFDPHPAPKMTDQQAAEFARYAWYAERPQRFFEEVERGKYTFEGAETARALMPSAFKELQERTADAIATHLSRGRSIPYQQRLVIDTMLDMNTLPSRRPDYMLTLQKNVVNSTQQANAAGPAPKKQGNAKIPTQRSALDRLEAGGPGRH